jgi:hypothetical protein
MQGIQLLKGGVALTMAFEFRKTDKRKEIFGSAIDRIGNLISQKSDSQAIDHSVKLGTKYIDRMRDAKKEYEEIEDKISELESRQRDLEDKWETEEISFSDI